ncbi:MAG: N-acetylmuramoyl-L-alanine amidase [Betaproteobacteria bacterium]|nr:N-acetylmuramoyl-L-alanine amidase [Betaproteobacteria bacterium]
MSEEMPGSLGRRGFCLGITGLTLLVTPFARAANAIGNHNFIAVRVWPAEVYTRVTLETDAAVRFTYFTLDNPDRLVVDIEGVEFGKALETISDKVSATDPYIKLLRAGRFKPGVVRLVMELKTSVVPQVFTLDPVGEYGHRLVLDVYPEKPVDPLMALLGERENVAAASPSGANASKAAEENRPAQGSERQNKPGVNRLVTIVLDPGHGGEDPGAIGRMGTREKNVTLAIARRLKTRLEKEKNTRVVLTRDGDYFVSLNNRVQKARRARADLFVSIHADAWTHTSVRGSSVFVLSEKGASSTAARLLAQKENNADLIGGVNLKNVQDPFLARTLLDLSQTATKTDSIQLAKAMLGELGSVNSLHKKGVEQAGFAVLRAPDIPSVLVETAFISNLEEERKLANATYQIKFADAMARGILRYLEQNPPLSRSTQT